MGEDTRLRQNTLAQVEILLSVDFVRIGLVCLVTLGLAGCMGVTGNPNAKSSPAPASIEVTPLTINFGNVAEGSIAQQAVNIANTGGVNAEITSAAMTGSGFTLKGMSLPLTISGGDSASFVVEFSPGSTEEANGSLVLTTSVKGSPITITFQGKGTSASIAATPSSASFGDVVVGEDATQPVQLRVSGTTSVKITKVTTTGSGFSISGISLPMTLTPGETASLVATFKPTASGSESGRISIISTAEGSPLTIDLSGKGASRVVSLSVTPTSLSFGSVGVGKSTSKEVSLKNTGNATADISSVSISGAGFSVSGAHANSTLGAGQSLTLTVMFDPSSSGSKSGTVTVASDAANSPGKISLSGSGTTTETTQTSQQHVVTLQWDQSTTTGVVGYYVYRGTQEGTYTRISPSLAATSYADSVPSGQNLVYYYVVTAVDSHGIESAFSNDVAVTIPSP